MIAEHDTVRLSGQHGTITSVHDYNDTLPTEYHVDVDGETVIVEDTTRLEKQ